MSKRKCGSCRFFQDSKLAASGWCLHPQRRTTSDIMIMVRRNELACRDQWSHDLWVDRDASEAETAAASAMGPLPARRMPPATPGEIAAVVQPRAAGTAAPVDETSTERPAEDVLVGETRVIGEPERDWTWGQEDTSASRVVDTRAAIMRAREAHRERLRTASASRPAEPARQRDDRTAPPPLAVGERLAERDDDAVGDTSAEGGEETIAIERVAAPPPVELRRPTPTPAPVGDFESVPEVRPEFELPTRPAARRPARPPEQSAESADGPVDHGRPAPRRAAEEWREPVAPRSLPRRTRADWQPERRRWDGPKEEQAASHARAGERPRIDVSAERDRAARELIEARREDRSSAYGRGRVSDDNGRAGVARDDVVEDDNIRDAMEEPTIDVVVEPHGGGDAPPEDVVLPNRSAVDPLVDLEIKVAPELPRVCRTCRDFRPAEGGGRGWCANEWAFTHRRMVDGGDPMPCETSLGSWWLPADEVWSAQADVSSHGQPTPLMDAIVGHHRDEPMRRRGS